MGLLDLFGMGDQPPQGLLADPNAAYSLIAGLLGGKKGEGLAPLGRGLDSAITAYRQSQQLAMQQAMQKQALESGAIDLQNKQTMTGYQQALRNAAMSGLPQGQQQGGPQQSTPQNPQFAVPPQAQEQPQGQPATQQTPQQMPPLLQQAQRMPGFGGPAGGVPMANWLMSDMTGKAYIEQLAKDYTEGQKPVINRGFGVGRMVNGQYIPDPASTEQAMAMERGKANISQPFETLNVTDASGATRPQFKYQLPGYPGATPPGAAAPSGPALPSALQPRQPAPQSGVASLQVTEPSKNAPQADPWATMPKRPIPQGMGQSSYDAELAKVQGSTLSRQAEKYGTNADIAQKRMALNNQSLDLVDRADTGPGAALIGDVKSLLVGRFGIPEKDFTNDPAATVALNKDLMNAAVARAKAMYGARMSTNEVNNMLKRGAPNGDMIKSAIKFLLESDNTAAAYDVQQSQDFGKYVSHGGDPLQFESWYAKTFPLDAKESQVKLPKGNQAADDAQHVTSPDGTVMRFPSPMAAQAYRNKLKQLGL